MAPKLLFRNIHPDTPMCPPGTPGNQGPHFNPRPFDPKTGNGSRNGSVSDLYDHYEFLGGL